MKGQVESSPSLHQQMGLIASEQPRLCQAIEQLVSGDFNARWGASKTLKSMGEVAYPALISMVKSKPQDSDLLGFIAEILGHHPSPQAILALVDLLKQSQDDEVQETVIFTLAKQGPLCIQELLTYLDHEHLQGPVLKALIQMNHPAAIEGFQKCVDHQDAGIRTLAFEGLGQFHQPAITPILIQGLKDTDANIRSTCLKALGRRGASEIDKTLISLVSPLLYDTNEKVCHLAAKTLGRFNHPLALEHLWHRLLEQPHPSSMIAVLIQSLGWTGESQGVDYLLKLLHMIENGEVPAFRQQSASALVIELIQVLSTLHDASNSTKVTLALIPLLRSTRKPHQTIQLKQSLTMAIAQLGQESAIPHLIQVLGIKDDRLRLHVIAALKQLNREQSYKQLLATSQELMLDPELQAGIAIALQEW